MNKLEWNDFKQLVDAYALTSSIKWVSNADYYDIYVETTTSLFNCRVAKTTPTETEQQEFEATYKL